MDFYSFYTGQEFEAYGYLGPHPVSAGWVFRTFAPQAARVELLIHGKEIPMEETYDGNFYEAFACDACEGDTYEYRIWDKSGKAVCQMDPYGYGAELRPAHKSILRNLSHHEFNDEKWMKSRSNMLNQPLNIYEIRAGSWKKPGEKPEDWYCYTELANQLIPYLKDHHYNYVEFMPLCEYPADQSWGYQSTGYYAPTSRYGSAQQLMEAIDSLHQNGIGVILDFVPVHFAMDDYALRNMKKQRGKAEQPPCSHERM